MSLLFEYDLFREGSWVLLITSLFADQTAWGAATAIVATTVALGHFRTLDLNLEKYSSDQREKLDEQIKAQRERRSSIATHSS